jgi:thioesterase domain-containing protein
LQPVPVGVTGELYIGGIGMARGYLNRLELTAEKFIPDPFSSKNGSRLYRTGDLGRFLPDGQLEFRGRVDHQVKIRGFRIELGEIEATLGKHPGVREAIVLAREDVPGNKRLVAYVVADLERTPNLRELREFLGGQLPEYAVPASFVFLESMPLSPNGKVDRRALPAPDSTRPDLEKAYVAPRDSFEEFLQARWQEKLGIDQIGVHDNFFQLGGDSVIAATLILKIQETLKERLSVVSLFQGPTIAELAATIRKQYPETVERIWGKSEIENPKSEGNSKEEKENQKPENQTVSDVPLRASPGAPLVRMQPNGSLSPFFCVHPPSGVVFLYAELARRMAPDHPFYAIQGCGLEDGEKAHESVEDMAAYCIETMRKVQPHGPYYVGGWSGGGTVAVEVAQQLTAAGEEVALLGLFDTGVAQSQDSYTRRIDHNAAERVGFLVGMAQNQGLEITPEELLPLKPEEQMDYICDKLDKANLPTAAAAPHPMGRILRVFESHFPTFLRYERKPYAGKITLFRASLSLDMSTPTWDPGSSPKLDHGWGRLAKEVEVIKVPGSHRSMVHEPHVAVLAEQLKCCINRTVEVRK